MDIDGERFRRLVDSILRLLILYEEELTAYHLVTSRAKEKIPAAQFDFDGAFGRVMSAPGLHVEAEAEYAELEPLLHPIDGTELPAALDRAVAAIDRRRKQYM